MRTFNRVLRSFAAITLFFFCWTFLPLWQVAAFAAEKPQSRKTDPFQSPLGKGGSRGVGATSGERFEKALEAIRENVDRLEKKHALSGVEGADKGEDDAKEREIIKTKRAEIESADREFRKEFSATEKKLKDANLPQDILARHYKFVKHYEDNLKELKTNLDAVGKYTADSKQGKDAIRKAKQHLEKTRTPSKHVPLDPNKLPHRMVKGKERAPRLKKEEFERDFPPQRHKGTKTAGLMDAEGREWMRIALAATSTPLRSPLAKGGYGGSSSNPILLASNAPASDTPLQLPRPARGEGWGEGRFPLPGFAFSDNLSSTSSEPRAVVLAQATVDLPTADDLAETPEVQFTPEIRNLAAQLGNKPTKIFEWVRNNIEFMPSYGSIQGADMCLQTKQCNALDTAALLIALLRVSNRPARYAYGTIEIPIEKIMNWVGGFTSERAALNFIASGGIPVTGKMSGGKIVAASMEHAWVETYIPYGNYRGAVMDESIKTWIPMDGSFKQYTYTNGFDMTTTVPFSQDAYLSQVQTQNAVHYYQSRIQEYLDVNMPETSIVDVKGYRDIEQEKYHFLPSTLPYLTPAVLGKFSTVPANMAAKVIITLSNPATGSDVSYTAITPELAGKRITVSYIPATENDETLIASFGGFLYNVPAYMLNLKPVLRIEGTIKLTGDALILGREQNLALRIEQTNGNLEIVNKKLLAGAYYAVAMDLQGINENVLGKRNYQLNTNVLSETAGTLGNDDLIGEHLFILATTYFLANDKIYKSGAKLYNTTMLKTISEGITSFTLTVSHVFSTPTAAMPSGINIDVALEGVVVNARDGNINKEKAYMDMLGLVGSYHEHDIFEKIDRFSSVSAVRALQVASANGIPIHRINAANMAEILTSLQVSPEIKTDIQNAINAGKEVTISQANVQINDWKGIGYIIKDPLLGSGAYMISGGLAGGNSTNKQDGMRIVEIHKDPGGWVKDNVDPQTRNTIVTAAELNVGELLSVAEAMVGMGYSDVNQCVGLVRIAYWAAGICLDMWSPWAPPGGTGSCGQNNLVQKHHISGTNGVSYFYNLANHLKINNSIKTTNDPLAGDLIF